MPRRCDYKPKPEKYCERCGTRLIPRTFSGREEDYSSFMKRKFCSLTCSSTRGKKGESRTQKMVQARASGLGVTCECCGGTERLAIHHVNEDWMDNRSENLQTLCVYCHQQWHGLHRRLGIRPYTRMPPLATLSDRDGVRVVHKIHWGTYRPELDACAPTATRSRSARAKPSSKPTSKPNVFD